jgi:hypothetical protein
MEFSKLRDRQGRPCPLMPSSPIAAVVDEFAGQVRDRIGRPGVVTERDRLELLEALGRVPDPRSRRGVRYPFTAILTAAVCAMLGGPGRSRRSENGRPTFPSRPGRVWG